MHRTRYTVLMQRFPKSRRIAEPKSFVLQFANPFLKPVDTKLYPDYPAKVTKPLDFGTVKSRLDAGNYTGNMEAFVKDMGQIFDNAFIYNAPGSTVHGWAVTLKARLHVAFSISCKIDSIAVSHWLAKSFQKTRSRDGSLLGSSIPSFQSLGFTSYSKVMECFSIDLLQRRFANTNDTMQLDSSCCSHGHTETHLLGSFTNLALLSFQMNCKMALITAQCFMSMLTLSGLALKIHSRNHDCKA